MLVGCGDKDRDSSFQKGDLHTYTIGLRQRRISILKKKKEKKKNFRQMIKKKKKIQKDDFIIRIIIIIIIIIGSENFKLDQVEVSEWE